MLYYSIDPKSFNALAHFEKQILRSKNICELKVKFLRPYCVVFLDQIIINEKNEDFRIYSTYKEANKYLKQIKLKNLCDNAQCTEQDFPETSMIRLIKYNGKETNLDVTAANWISDNILKFINTGELLSKKITENIWEIINNGLVHGGNANGISIAGQFYPLKKYFEIAFYDRGIGIPGLIRKCIKNINFENDSSCIEWAMEKGHSTDDVSNASGLGLYYLREFIKGNNGHLPIISGNGYFCIDKSNDHIKETINNFIKGTIVNIRINYN